MSFGRTAIQARTRRKAAELIFDDTASDYKNYESQTEYEGNEPTDPAQYPTVMAQALRSVGGDASDCVVSAWFEPDAASPDSADFTCQADHPN